jgi:hypothetical protein
MVKRAFVLLVAALLLAGAARASYISLNTTVSVKVEGQQLKLLVSAVNKGDEAAYNVQAECRVAGRSVLAAKSGELPVNAPYQATLTMPLALPRPGSYPLVLVMHYTDANQYPFSALSVQTFIYRQEAVAPLFGRVRSTAFAREGQLNFKLKNLGERELRAGTRLVAPRELTSEQAEVPLVLAPRSEQGGSFTVHNFSALAGSTYQVFAVTEFDDGGLHYTGVAPGTIKIVEERSFLGLGQTAIIVILAVLVLVFISAQFIKK